jgi:hypothetical protein
MLGISGHTALLVYGAEPKPGQAFVKPNVARRGDESARAFHDKINRYIEIELALLPIE